MHTVYINIIIIYIYMIMKIYCGDMTTATPSAILTNVYMHACVKKNQDIHLFLEKIKDC